MGSNTQKFTLSLKKTKELSVLVIKTVENPKLGKKMILVDTKKNTFRENLQTLDF